MPNPNLQITTITTFLFRLSEIFHGISHLNLTYHPAFATPTLHSTNAFPQLKSCTLPVHDPLESFHNKTFPHKTNKLSLHLYSYLTPLSIPKVLRFFTTLSNLSLHSVFGDRMEVWVLALFRWSNSLEDNMERLPAPRMMTWAHLRISLAGGQDGEFERQLEMLTSGA